jgi:hypothetical protein
MPTQLYHESETVRPVCTGRDQQEHCLLLDRKALDDTINTLWLEYDLLSIASSFLCELRTQVINIDILLNVIHRVDKNFDECLDEPTGLYLLGMRSTYFELRIRSDTSPCRQNFYIMLTLLRFWERRAVCTTHRRRK